MKSVKHNSPSGPVFSKKMLQRFITTVLVITSCASAYIIIPLPQIMYVIGGKPSMHKELARAIDTGKAGYLALLDIRTDSCPACPLLRSFHSLRALLVVPVVRPVPAGSWRPLVHSCTPWPRRHVCYGRSRKDRCGRFVERARGAGSTRRLP